MNPGLLKFGAFLFCILSLTAAGRVYGVACTKFSGTASNTWYDNEEGVCYYGFDTPYTWNNAVTLCTNEDTHLVHLQTTGKQQAVFTGLGSNFQQHWVGLRMMGGIWKWFYNSSYSVDASSDINGRWEGSTVADAAYTTTSNQVILKGGRVTDSYRPVCEDNFIPSAAVDIAVTTVQPAVTVTSIDSESDTMVSGLFTKMSVLQQVERIVTLKMAAQQQCAVVCLRTSGCRYFAYTASLSDCELFEDIASGFLSDYFCIQSTCYSRQP